MVWCPRDGDDVRCSCCSLSGRATGGETARVTKEENHSHFHAYDVWLLRLLLIFGGTKPPTRLDNLPLGVLCCTCSLISRLLAVEVDKYSIIHINIPDQGCCKG